ncbi:sulfotransferase family protein [Endozoicomonas sp. SM1973]|uniref:Sulfotransferase family protein n=1 Tax=Spartinivicinus marinus TaxID=2994442 RepID=A0A853IBV9_9GAMM|nr:sulfotransferase family protein [Spartinivicinus marinus]MCX4026216.1 hypothetical protein [Spartinivicinus marinus]NYZ67371.1 sulfotransferase family protein [Spartinivicinus marinus]
MHIIGAGFGRTGTVSIREALAIVGYSPCYHMDEVIRNPHHIDFFLNALTGKLVDWNSFFEPYQATLDWPACCFYRELMVEYPNAKVLLNIRDAESWYESAKTTVFLASRTNVLRTQLLAPFSARYRYRKKRKQFMHESVWNSIFQGRFLDKSYAIDMYNQWNNDVIEHVPSDRLLIYNIKDGWPPLLNFLGINLKKNTPFPNLNSRDVFLKSMKNDFQAGFTGKNHARAQ